MSEGELNNGDGPAYAWHHLSSKLGVSFLVSSREQIVGPAVELHALVLVIASEW